ncbi:hypothetical protein F5888DRAFT_1664156 [Russula emetica]|nr:hypothetical protein F5888DRAFT_1664156 [Russula emetica]
MGIGYPDCSAVNDRLIYASITGTFVLLASPFWHLPMTSTFIGYHGQTGPYRTAAGYDVVIEGEAGLMHMQVEYQSL